RTRLEQHGPVSHVWLNVPGTGWMFHILHPVSIDRLLDAVALDPEQNLPYWAEIWPSGIGLARTILEQGGALKGKRTLEIGSGLGITATAAITAGAHLTVTDYSSRSLLFCRYNTLHKTGRQPRTFQLNWRQPSKGLLAEAGAGFDAILAADILYESRDVEPLLALIDRLITPAGTLWLAEPGRPVARIFLAHFKLLAGPGPSKNTKARGQTPRTPGCACGCTGCIGPRRWVTRNRPNSILPRAVSTIWNECGACSASFRTSVLTTETPPAT
ncbi:MAG TPA: methyltransferase, partial [Nitrolancea sp.]|nr:methyltransferase [Nitrolancea sp.]